MHAEGTDRATPTSVQHTPLAMYVKEGDTYQYSTYTTCNARKRGKQGDTYHIPRTSLENNVQVLRVVAT
ncbi:predicted protein [Lichtheimia corymbifera JMRC:FSU:9682]|uniref:Uncharacterized protein n=1 Tax=Lichtheimia corymbifera JMRC:FSU:9682 TaxID=1263082 RepID=A0A068SEE0_9FUNG|nr:predicted protein [Lichtheimia corymbifera JMRC:FSU:9682]